MIANRPPAYPYGDLPLRPRWRAAQGRAIATLAISCSLLSLALHYETWPPHKLALQAILPGVLAFVLGFAPKPPHRVTNLAKDLIASGAALGCFAGDWLPPAILAVPAFFAISIA